MAINYNFYKVLIIWQDDCLFLSKVEALLRVFFIMMCDGELRFNVIRREHGMAGGGDKVRDAYNNSQLLLNARKFYWKFKRAERVE